MTAAEDRRGSTRAAGVVGMAILSSRVLGLIRETIFAGLFGAGKNLDAFLMAFRLPNLLRDLFAEGALSTAFITTFSKKIAVEGDESAWRLANKVATLTAVFMSVVTLLGIVFAPQLVDQLPHVKRSTSCGANTMPSSVTTLMKTAVSVATLFARRHADSSPSTAIFFENVVMNAVDSAPSANKSRSRFGNRNAIKNASRFFPAPNKPANTVSRIRPRTRLDRMAMPTTPVARVLIRRSSAAAIGEC